MVDRRSMNFQVTVLKVLVSYPHGFATIAEIKRDVELLFTSGADFANLTRRLAARVPNLRIFTDRLVTRRDGGWQITDHGRDVLAFMEARSEAYHQLPTRPPPRHRFGAPHKSLREFVRREAKKTGALSRSWSFSLQCNALAYRDPERNALTPSAVVSYFQHRERKHEASNNRTFNGSRDHWLSIFRANRASTANRRVKRFEHCS